LTSLKKQTSGVGTPIYMAPEVLDGSTYSTSADVYSYSMLLLELFTGVEPYSNDRFPAPWHIARFISQGRRLPIPSIVPPFVAKLIRSGWKQNPAERLTFDEIITVITTGHLNDDSSSSDSNSDTSSGDEEEEKKEQEVKTKSHGSHKPRKKHHKHKAKEKDKVAEDDGSADIEEENVAGGDGGRDTLDYEDATVVDTDQSNDSAFGADAPFPSRVRRLSMSENDFV